MSRENIPQSSNPFLGLFNPESLDIGGVIRRRKLIVIGGVVFCLTLALIYQFIASEKFESKAQVLIMPKDNGLAARSYRAQTKTVPPRSVRT